MTIQRGAFRMAFRTTEINHDRVYEGRVEEAQVEGEKVDPKMFIKA